MTSPDDFHWFSRLSKDNLLLILNADAAMHYQTSATLSRYSTAQGSGMFISLEGELWSTSLECLLQELLGFATQTK